jgi:membrane protein DedA with SNARE-associated domain
MNGRFPFDVFAIILFPFLLIAMSAFFTPLLVPDHVHHRFAVVFAIALAVIVTFAAFVARMRRRKRSADDT